MILSEDLSPESKRKRNKKKKTHKGSTMGLSIKVSNKKKRRGKISTFKNSDPKGLYYSAWLSCSLLISLNPCPLSSLNIKYEVTEVKGRVAQASNPSIGR